MGEEGMERRRGVTHNKAKENGRLGSPTSDIHSEKSSYSSRAWVSRVAVRLWMADLIYSNNIRRIGLIIANPYDNLYFGSQGLAFNKNLPPVPNHLGHNALKIGTAFCLVNVHSISRYRSEKNGRKRGNDQDEDKKRGRDNDNHWRGRSKGLESSTRKDS